MEITIIPNTYKFIGSIYDKGPGLAGAVFDINYLAPTLTCMTGGNREPLVVVKENDRRDNILWKSE